MKGTNEGSPNFLSSSTATDLRPDMTVVDFLQEELAYQSKVLEAKYEAKVAALKAKFEATKAALWQTHNELVAGDYKENADTNVKPPSLDDDSNKMNKKKPAAGKKAAKGPVMVCGRAINPSLPFARFKCVESVGKDCAHYIGTEWALQPTIDKPCVIGRSKHKKCTSRGMSLSDDGEVSSTHAEIGVSRKNRTLYYKDVGSSNGSYVVDEKKEEDLLQPNIEIDLVSGSVFRIGVCLYEVTLH